ncbi:hypothetical protein [Flaviflexus massiliensis]|uniref:hypothetical protein n=1 Tax=Flaviflexus massiliensis TaxID=1522309 RepID=UPI0006D5B660|nr:hypothetical protein [Flaviflexus massiliensis]
MYFTGKRESPSSNLPTSIIPGAIQTNVFRGGNAEHQYNYGRATDSLVVGDWNGDGNDTLGVCRGNTYHLKNTTTGGWADIVMTYGKSTDQVVIGDWDNNGTDTLGVYRP